VVVSQDVAAYSGSMWQALQHWKRIVVFLGLLTTPSGCNPGTSVGGQPDASSPEDARVVINLDASLVLRDAATGDGASRDTIGGDAVYPPTGRPCRSEDPDSCVCDQFSGGTQVTACSAATVIQADDETSGCCQHNVAGFESCECVAYICLEDTSRCTCDRVGNTDGPYNTGTRVTACAGAAGGQTCCMLSAWPRSCSCSSGACLTGWTEVSGCSAADLAAICPTGDVAVSVCL
jgi:hypothetical protein